MIDRRTELHSESFSECHWNITTFKFLKTIYHYSATKSVATMSDRHPVTVSHLLDYKVKDVLFYTHFYKKNLRLKNCWIETNEKNI